MDYFTRHTYLGKTPDGDFYVTIKWEHTRNNKDELSITGVIGPKANGDARGSCGQTGVPDDITTFAPGWDAEDAAILADLWKRWHLNGMRAGSPRQQEYLRQNPVTFTYPASHYDTAKAALGIAMLDPDESYLHNGKPYSYGSAWLYEEVPEDVLAWLRDRPDNADRLPDRWR